MANGSPAHRTPAASNSNAWSRRLAVVLASYAVAGGLVSFAGWAADVPGFTDWDSDGISIQPNAAVAVTLAGLSVLFLIRGARRVSAAAGFAVAAIGGLTLFEYVSGVSLGIDDLLMFGREWGRVGVLSPGRMGPPGALSWTIVGSALVMASSGRVRLRAASPFLVLVAACIASLSILGYAYGASPLYTIPTMTVIAFQTSTFILAVSIALVLAVEEYGPMRLLGDQGVAGTVVRRLLPAVLLMPVALGFLRLAGQRAGFYDLAFGTAVRTLIEIVLFLAVIWWTARAISAQSRARADAEAQLESDLADSLALQELSAASIQEDDADALHQRVLATAVRLARSQFASIQICETDPTTGQQNALRLLASHGFNEYARTAWQRVTLESHCACADALRRGERVEIPDVLVAESLKGTTDAETYARAGIRAVQTTPLLTRAGQVLGMLSTHWAEPHSCTARELRLIDILVRQAADIIERRQQEDALRAADRKKDVFLMTLAHELRNPLAPVRGAVDILKKLPISDPDLRRVRDITDRQTSVMARLLDDLLDLGRITQDRIDLRREPVDLREVLRSAVDMSGPIAEERGHWLEVSIPEQPLYVLGDEVRLSQIVGNLLNNACRYTNARGSIRASLERAGSEAVVTIEDNGIGIPETHLARIFEMFSQVDTSLERSRGGLGIGLHLVKRLVDLHAGTVEARSQGPGLGSTFIVRLPALEQPETTRQPVPALAGARQRRRRILIVDDNIDAAEILSTLLAMGDYETAVAHDGNDALVMSESFRPDIVLLDIGLPGMSGYDVCTQIRSQAWGAGLLLIALTGWGQESDRTRSRDAGFDHHMVKPVDHQALLKLLEAVPTP